jgi:hypothetical protein
LVAWWFLKNPVDYALWFDWILSCRMTN